MVSAEAIARGAVPENHNAFHWNSDCGVPHNGDKHDIEMA
jgi:hypothetical protein